MSENLDRIMKQLLVGSAGGLVSKHSTAAVLGGGARAGTQQAIGDLLLGVPEEHTFKNEASRGAVGGAIVGALDNPLHVMTNKKSLPMIKKFFLKYGAHPSSAGIVASLVAAGALGGAATGALTSGTMQSLTEDWK